VGPATAELGEMEGSRSAEKASKFLVEAQGDDGDWPQQTICGVFNQNCIISSASTEISS